MNSCQGQQMIPNFTYKGYREQLPRWGEGQSAEAWT